MAYHLRCHVCSQHLYCAACGTPVDSDAHVPGQVGKRHTWVPFDPARRGSWKAERGRILLALAAAPLLSREAYVTAGGSSPNQTCTRMGELHTQGLVERTGKVRYTETGSPADE